MNIGEKLKYELGENLLENQILAKFTTFQIGGPAKYFFIAKTKNELAKTLKLANELNLKILILGGGSNMLISDLGFNGLVIKIENQELKVKNEKIICGAGIELLELVKMSVKNNLRGLEKLAGIPGTVGGAIRGNAGAFGQEMKDKVESVEVVAINGEIRNLSNNECGFQYRNSIFKKTKDLVVWSCVIKLENGDAEKIKNETESILKHREVMHPSYHDFPSAGSMFKNPIVKNQELIKEFEQEKNTECRGSKLPAGWLIEKAGLKGKRINGASVSDKQANFIINDKIAKAKDVAELIAFVKQEIYSQFKIRLEEEVQYIGFD